MAKYFMSRLIYFHKQISCHITLASVLSGLFHTIFTAVVSTRGPVTHS